jgi:hypothetical protein
VHAAEVQSKSNQKVPSKAQEFRGNKQRGIIESTTIVRLVQTQLQENQPSKGNNFQTFGQRLFSNNFVLKDKFSLSKEKFLRNVSQKHEYIFNPTIQLSQSNPRIQTLKITFKSLFRGENFPLKGFQKKDRILNERFPEQKYNF